MSEDITPEVDEQVEADSQGLTKMEGSTQSVDLHTEIQKSYLDYAMSVIVGQQSIPEIASAFG